mgnify:CR=1 FL=1
MIHDEGDGDTMELNIKEFSEKVGKKILELRLRKGYTREYLAELADISPKFLYEIEGGKKCCSSYVLYRISRSLEVNSDYFISEENILENTQKWDTMIRYFSISQIEEIQEIIQALYRLIHTK